MHPCLILAAETAAELMTDNPVSIRADATLAEAIALLTDKNMSAAPVIGECRAADRRCEPCRYPHSRARAMPCTAGPMDIRSARDLMTPAVFSVTPETTAGRVVEEMVALMFTSCLLWTHDGSLVGIIRAIRCVARASGRNGAAPLTEDSAA